MHPALPLLSMQVCACGILLQFCSVPSIKLLRSYMNNALIAVSLLHTLRSCQ